MQRLLIKISTYQGKIMDWFYLTIAGLLEVVWASSLKYTDGFSKPIPSLFTLAAITASFILLAEALKTLPIGTGYAVWTGIGVVGTAIVGSIFLGEPRDLPRLICISLIILGIVGLRFAGSK
jgi:quaternary ammonium compound-resistance protein SugE